MAEPVDHLDHVAAAIAADVVSYVRGHPQYAEMVKSLGDTALRALAAEAGIPL